METNHPLPFPATQPDLSRSDGKKKRTKSSGFLKWITFSLLSITTLSTLALLWLFLTPSGTQLRYVMADTLITTQHRHWAKYVIGQSALDDRVAAYQQEFDSMGEEKDEHTIPSAVVTPVNEPLVTIEDIEGEGYKGYLVYVRDPKKIRLVVPNSAGKGEKVSSMVKRTGAILGVNAGGFADPNWKGNGFQPTGLVISNGRIFYNGGSAHKPTHIVGIDKNGKMIAGKYTPEELLHMGLKEGVTFQPRLIVNGKGLVKNAADGWGIAPRTVMAQKADGTILFVIIDGRQPGYSLGANLYEIQNLLLEKGAVIAANLDGGSSTVLVKDNEIVNRPSSQYGERYLPTAFLVFEHPDEVEIKNIWEGMDPKDIDPSKW